MFLFSAQVLGTGDRKVLTLSHRAQVKRFISDVLKVLKQLPGKQLVVSDLASAYGKWLPEQQACVVTKLSSRTVCALVPSCSVTPSHITAENVPCMIAC